MRRYFPINISSGMINSHDARPRLGSTNAIGIEITNTSAGATDASIELRKARSSRRLRRRFAFCRVPEHRRLHEAGEPERDGVEHDGDRLGVAVAPDQRGGEGHERDRGQVHEVELHEAHVDGDEAREEAVVGEPVEADHDEAQEEREDLVVLVAEMLAELASRTWGMPIPTTSRVMAMAKTASLKNATRSNSRSSERRR